MLPYFIKSETHEDEQLVKSGIYQYLSIRYPSVVAFFWSVRCCVDVKRLFVSCDSTFSRKLREHCMLVLIKKDSVSSSTQGYHGKDGSWNVETSYNFPEFTDLYLNASKELGYDIVEDHNGKMQGMRPHEEDVACSLFVTKSGNTMHTENTSAVPLPLHGLYARFKTNPDK